jgi:hypothetical protein
MHVTLYVMRLIEEVIAEAKKMGGQPSDLVTCLAGQWLLESHRIESTGSYTARLDKVRALLSTDGTKKAASAAPVRKRRKMSAAAQKRMGDAQRKRWAKQKASDK